MKTLFAFIGVLALALCGVVFYAVKRPAEKKASDWQQLKDWPNKVWAQVMAASDYARTLFSSKPEQAAVAAPKAA